MMTTSTVGSSSSSWCRALRIVGMAALLMLMLVVSVSIPTFGKAGYDHCDDIGADNLKVGDRCWMGARSVRPTQLVVGLDEVKWKVEKMGSMKKKKLEAYLVDHSVPVVKGLNKKFYATDHHHTTRAIIEAYDQGLVKSPKACEVLVRVIGDLSYSSNHDTFWTSMMKRGWVWLYDEKGRQPINPYSLPDSMMEMIDDLVSIHILRVYLYTIYLSISTSTYTHIYTQIYYLLD